MDYRYSLRKGSKKTDARTASEKTFVPYVDKNTGREAGEEVR